MNCPNCNEILVMSERHGVEIDYCPKCRGVWLDRGELDKIIEKTNAQLDTREHYEEHRNPYPQHGEHSYDSHKHKKKKGFLGDFFDFD
jgi:uncharacterized protein